jgi:hypothetical protein
LRLAYSDFNFKFSLQLRNSDLLRIRTDTVQPACGNFRVDMNWDANVKA